MKSPNRIITSVNYWTKISSLKLRWQEIDKLDWDLCKKMQHLLVEVQTSPQSPYGLVTYDTFQQRNIPVNSVMKMYEEYAKILISTRNSNRLRTPQYHRVFNWPIYEKMIRFKAEVGAVHCAREILGDFHHAEWMCNWSWDEFTEQAKNYGLYNRRTFAGAFEYHNPDSCRVTLPDKDRIAYFKALHQARNSMLDRS